jgi:hypothetical protein
VGGRKLLGVPAACSIKRRVGQDSEIIYLLPMILVLQPGLTFRLLLHLPSALKVAWRWERGRVGKEMWRSQEVVKYGSVIEDVA